MKLRPNAPSRVPVTSPEVVKKLSYASWYFTTAGTLSMLLGLYLLWGVPAALLFIGTESLAIGVFLHRLKTP